ncbi:MAG: prephenate dehydrogenase/arogenate dehydrogenase family protein [Clostridia bacterium]|nr:prephenate dehydrogenase/arogenate dehydrogenase family protein [Clostridia bacterium]
MNCKNIAIVGLGLIGGSVLKALQGFENATFYGIDLDETVLSEAKKQGLISNETLTSAEILKLADVVFVCLPPDATLSFINSNIFKENALITDVSGVKQAICKKITQPDLNYIGGHPMAGKEESGFAASDAKLFQNASYLLTPTPEHKQEHIELLQKMALYMGFRETVLTNPEEHDRMIAYTSQLMHIVAVALCDSERLDDSKRFSAGSLRDCTRVAKLDSNLWTRLFLLNKEDLVDCIDEFSESLKKVRNLIAEEKESELKAFLEEASDRKRRFLA